MAIAFVQAATSGGAGSFDDPAAVLAAFPTAGNLLVALLNDASGTDDGLLTPAGFTNIPAVAGSGAIVGLACFHFAYRIAQAGDSKTVTGLTPGTALGMIGVAEYSGAWSAASLIGVSMSAVQGGTDTATIPARTPAAGSSRLLVVGGVINPNYSPAAAAGYTMRAQPNDGGSSRIDTMLMDRIVPIAAGPYTGTLGPVGFPTESSWLVFQAEFAEAAGGGIFAGEPGGGVW